MKKLGFTALALATIPLDLVLGLAKLIYRLVLLLRGKDDTAV